MAVRTATVDAKAPPHPIDSPIQGIVLITAGIAVFSIQDIIIRSLSATYPALEIMFIRGLAALIPIAVLVYLGGGWSSLRVPHPFINLVRGLLQVTSYTAYYMAMTAMPLADVTAILFVSPLIVTLLSALFLGESVGPRRWLAVVVGLGGILIIVRPSSAMLEPEAFLVLAAAFTYATSVVITRRIGRSQSGASLAFIAMAIFVAVSGAAGIVMGDGAFANESHPSLSFLLRAWATPDGRDLLLLSACGMIAAIGFYCLAQGYRIAPASLVAPFEFISMPLAVLWGILIWDEVPSPATLLGILLIVGSGIYVLNREAVHKRHLSTGRGIRLRL
jgi:S-adenosylmethionine uptake transporter